MAKCFYSGIAINDGHPNIQYRSSVEHMIGRIRRPNNKGTKLNFSWNMVTALCHINKYVGNAPLKIKFEVRDALHDAVTKFASVMPYDDLNLYLGSKTLEILRKYRIHKIGYFWDYQQSPLKHNKKHEKIFTKAIDMWDKILTPEELLLHDFFRRVNDDKEHRELLKRLHQMFNGYTE